MLVTRIYLGRDGRSHFEELDLPLAVSDVGALSSAIPVESLAGQGHISREVEGQRLQVFAPLAEGVDLDRWRR